MNSELTRLFDEPSPEFSPAPLWWWSGEKVTRERLTEQLEQLAGQGVKNVVVINLAPAGPMVGAVSDDPLWFSEEWWDRFADACEICERLGMRIWFYDQIGFSGANLQGRLTQDHPEYAGATLHRTVLRVGADGRVAVPPPATPVAAYDADGRRITLGDDGRLADGEATPETQVTLAYTLPTAYDYLSPEACDALRDLVHGEFERRMPERLGRVIAGSFQDELPMHNSWTPHLAEEFTKRRGYDLLDVLPALWAPETTEDGAKVLGDYYRTRAELAEEAFFRPLGEWHSRYGMLVGADQLNPARGGQPIQATQFYSDYFRTHRWFGAAGSDHEGDIKVHSSMAHLYGHDRVWCESFHSSGWGGTLEDTYDWLLPFFQSGATLYNPHAVYYSMRGGWFEWAPPSTDWRQPYWGQYGPFAQAVSRICSLLSWGTPVCDVAVLHPAGTVRARLPLDAPVDHNFDAADPGPEYGPLARLQIQYLELVGQNNWFHHRPGALREAAVEYDIVDEDSLQRAVPEAGWTAIDALRYRWVVLPGCAVLETATARYLLELLDAGGRVALLGEPPSAAAERGGDDELVRRIAAHPRVLTTDDPAELARRLAEGTRPLRSSVPVLARAKGSEGVAFVPAASPNASRYPLRDGSGWWWKDHDFDPARYAASTTLWLDGTPAAVELWNPATGERRPARFAREGGQTRVEVDFAGAPAQLVVWSDEPSPAAALRPSAGGKSAGGESSALAIEGPWHGTLLPTLGAVNARGDVAKPDGSEPAPQIWEFEAAEAPDGPWSTVHATFGPHGLAHPATTVAELPTPLLLDRAAAAARGEDALAEETAWYPVEYSDSRGIHKDPRHKLGPKGRVPEEFLSFPGPASGEGVQYRTVVGTGVRGTVELLVGAGAAKRVWWNGVEVTPEAEPMAGEGYLLRAPVTAGARNVLEIRLTDWSRATGMHEGKGTSVDAFWALAEPGGFPDRPEYLTTTAPEGGRETRFLREFAIDAVPDLAEALVGAAVELSLLVNGEPVARQAKVEYYAGWEARPAFFVHDVRPALRPGRNTLEVVLHSSDPRAVVLVDLAMERAGDVRTVVSDASWHTFVDERSFPVRLHKGQWDEPAAIQRIARPHPLPATSWLNGPPAVGTETLRTDAAPEAVDAPQWFRMRLPVGTARVRLPVRGTATVRLADRQLPCEDGQTVLDPPLTSPSELLVRVAGAGLARGGAAWDGPAEVDVAPGPIPLGDWATTLGLTTWSGGLEYRTRVRLTAEQASARTELRLGELRGSVEVLVNGRSAALLFCRPWSADTTGLLAEGENDIVVRVYNTLAPYLHAVSPTRFVFPSQLVSGLRGPVELHFVQ